MNTDHTISPGEFASIEQYLLGETSEADRLAFEKKMETDNAWAAKVKEVKLLLTGIETASLQERLDAYHSGLKKNHTPRSAGKLISLPLKIAAAAAVAMLIATAVWFYITKQNRYEELYAVYYKPDPGLISAMGVGENYLFNKAMLDYKTGNYRKAIDAWSRLKTDMPHNDTLNYFLGAALQAEGNNASAIGLLQLMASDASKPFYKDACWYMGFALVKQGKVKEAIPYLENAGRSESVELISKLK